MDMDGYYSLSEKLLLTPEEVAFILGQSRSTVYEKLASGDLPSVKIGRSRRITREAVHAFVAGLDGKQS